MRFWLFLVLGLLTVMEIVSKAIRCATCEADYIGFEMSGYTYLALQSALALILLYGAYSEWGKKGQSPKNIKGKNYQIAAVLIAIIGVGVMGYSHGSGSNNFHGQILVFIGLAMSIMIPLLNNKKNKSLDD